MTEATQELLGLVAVGMLSLGSSLATIVGVRRPVGAISAQLADGGEALAKLSKAVRLLRRDLKKVSELQTQHARELARVRRRRRRGRHRSADPRLPFRQ